MRRSFSARLLAAALFGLASVARAQGPEVELQLHGIFGDEALLGDAYGSVVITARNLGGRMLRGTVRARTVGVFDVAPCTYESALDLPPGQARRVVLTTFVASGQGITAEYVVDGTPVAVSSRGTSYAPATRSIVVMADPPRMTAALAGMRVEVADPDPAFGARSTRVVEVPVGTVSFDATSGDPIVPDDALGWANVAVVVASLPTVGRLTATQARALREWVHAGGHLVLAPRTDADLRAPIVRDLMGDVARAEDLLPDGPLTPPGVRALRCAAAEDEESFGCTRPAGHGTVHVLAYDPTARPHVDAPQSRALVRAVAWRALGVSTAHLPLGRQADRFDVQWWTGPPSFTSMRRALDPNEAYRPALGLVAIVLLLYVIAVGPVNFRLVQARNVPTLALLTTPALALGCALLMLGVGYLGKGVRSRYRRVEIVDAIEGSALAPARAYAGLFLTRPSSVSLAMPARGRTLRLSVTGRDDGLVIRSGGERPRLTNLRGGIWETLFVRTDRMVELGGAVTFRYDDRVLTAVTNGTRHALRGAIVVQGDSAYLVGDVAPGQTRPIPRAAITLPPSYASDEEMNERSARIASWLGLEADDGPYIRAVLDSIGPAPAPSIPVLWASMEPEPLGGIAPRLARDRDLRLLLLQPRGNRQRLTAPPPETDASALQDTSPPAQAAPSVPTDAAVDAGVGP